MASTLNATSTPEGEKNRWATQWACFRDAVKLYGREFDFDVAAESCTSKCGLNYFGPDREHVVYRDALQAEWPDHWWCNPPFDRKVEFIQHARLQQLNGRPGMMLLPYEPLTGWWRKNLAENVIIYEPDGRYNFLHVDGETPKSGANFGSVFVAFPTMQIGQSVRVQFMRGIGCNQ